MIDEQYALPSNIDLKKFLDESIILSQSMLKTILGYETTFEKMCVCYLRKQLDHAISIKKLNNNYDILLISRSMVEAMLSLLWVAKKPNERADRWDDYKHTYDFKRLLQWRHLDKNFHHERDSAIIACAREYAEKYLPRKKAKKMDEASVGRHPFTGHWSGKSIYEIAEELGENGKMLYHGSYHFCSEWAHSTSTLFFLMEQDSHNCPEIYDEQIANSGLYLGLQSLLQTMEVVIKKFNSLNYRDKKKYLTIAKRMGKD